MKRCLSILIAVMLVITMSVGVFAAEQPHDHELTHVRAKDARIAKQGNVEHYYCAVCDKYYSDSEGTKQLQKETVFFDLPCHEPNNSDTGKGSDFSIEALINLDSSMQGTAIYGEYLFVANNEAVVKVYDIPSRKLLDTYQLASATPDLAKNDPHANHSNQMMFGTVKWAESDPFPLLYISTGNTGDFYDDDGTYVAKCAVERIVVKENADGSVSFSNQLVQTIAYSDKDFVKIDKKKYNDSVETFKGMYRDGRFTYIGNSEWANTENYQKIGWGWPASFVDSDPTAKTAGKFYLHGARFRTTEKWEGLNREIYTGDDTGIKYKEFNYDDHNAYIITVFDMPALPASEAEFGKTVVLTPKDITDQFETEFDIYFTQGGTLYQGKIYYPFGNGGEYGSPTANGIRIFDIEQEKIVARVDLSEDRIGMGSKEPECCAIYHGKLCMSAASKTSSTMDAIHIFGYVALDDGKNGTVCSMCGESLSDATVDPTDPSQPSVPDETKPQNEEQEGKFEIDPFFILMGIGDLVVVGGLLLMMKRRRND